MRFLTPIMAFVAASFSAAVVYAQNGFVPLATAEQSPMLDAVYKTKGLGDYVNTLFTVALSVGAILAVIRIAYAGYLYMGSDMWGNKQKAREMLGDVTLGLLLLLSIVLILKQINPDLLNLNVLNKVNQASGTTGTNSAPVYATPAQRQ